MFFNGDLSKYHPADALMFLSHLGLNGILSVDNNSYIISLTFKDGKLLDAQSPLGDDKMLRSLQYQKRIDMDCFHRVQTIQAETGMSVRQILGELGLFHLSEIKDVLRLGIDEVLLELFQLENGNFSFTDTTVDVDSTQISMDAGKIALKILPQTDEIRDFEKTARSFDRVVKLNWDQQRMTALPLQTLTLLKLCTQGICIGEIAKKAPFSSYQVLKGLEKLLNQEAISLLPLRKDQPDVAPTCPDPLFSAYRQTLKALMGAVDVIPKLEALISFCKRYYDEILIFTARDLEIIHAKIITVDLERGVLQRSLKSSLGRIDCDPVFYAVYRSGVGFFGKPFSSTLLNKLVKVEPGGECALIPMLNKSGIAMLVYAYTAKQSTILSPHHYLELLSWMVTPDQSLATNFRPSTPSVKHNPSEPKALKGAAGAAPPSKEDEIAELVSKIEDLPPLPSMVSKTLTLLSDPDASAKAIESAVSQDQALVTKIIKVSNSALYGGYQRVNTLPQALIRLGARTTKSLILAISTKSYFLNRRKGMKIWGEFLWQHAMECGIASRRIAEAVDYDDMDEAFLGGIIHDIGKLIILLLFPDKFQYIQRVKKKIKLPDKSAELQVVGADHEQVGAMLLDQWHMPETVKACARFHHRFKEADRYKELTAIVAYGNYISHMHGANPKTMLPEEMVDIQDLVRALGLPSQDNDDLIETITNEFQTADLMI